ncbi:MAG: prolipoprotein diacylglyceryl transferase [Chloroflexi bacterium]|nr:prolipoprotein diacylglyceryl transferase [Chloroflexota bacterium]
MINIGPLTIQAFSLIILAAAAAAATVTGVLAARVGLSLRRVLDMVILALLLGIVFARLDFALNPPPSVRTYYDAAWFYSHIFDFQAGLVAVWNGGMGRAGALIGAMAAIALNVWRDDADWAQWAGPIAWGTLAWFVIAPWANVTTGHLFGPPVPWSAAGHPTPVYVSVWALLTGIAVWTFGRGTQRVPWLIALSLSVGLFLSDFLRVDMGRVLGLTSLQITLLAAGIVLAVTFYSEMRRHDRNERADQTI